MSGRSENAGTIEGQMNNLEMLRLSLEDSGNAADNEASRDQALALEPQPDGGSNAGGTRIFMSCSGRDFDDHLERLLECPVCYDMILPPIICCVAGHTCCEPCRKSLKTCPVCRGNFTNVRNLFAEQFLDKCMVKCRNGSYGCPTVLPARELSVHCQQYCNFRPIHCRECDVYVPFEDYLEHVRIKDKIEKQKASECSTGFEIEDSDFSSGGFRDRQAVWEPTWMHCYGYDFFCSLEHNSECWWIWISSLTHEGCKYKGQVIVWNRLKGSEISFTGRIHSIHETPEVVITTGECLIMKDKVVKDLMYHGGIDVLVRIERIYNPPRTRKGLQVESPFEAMSRDRITTSTTTSATPIHRAVTDLASDNTPLRILRSSANATRIPTSVDSRSPISSVRRLSGGTVPSPAGGDNDNLPRSRAGQTRRVLFSSVLPTPLRTRNPRQAIATRRDSPATQAAIEVIDIDREE